MIGCQLERFIHSIRGLADGPFQCLNALDYECMLMSLTVDEDGRVVDKWMDG